MPSGHIQVPPSRDEHLLGNAVAVRRPTSGDAEDEEIKRSWQQVGRRPSFPSSDDGSMMRLEADCQGIGFLMPIHGALRDGIQGGNVCSSQATTGTWFDVTGLECFSGASWATRTGLDNSERLLLADGEVENTFGDLFDMQCDRIAVHGAPRGQGLQHQQVERTLQTIVRVVFAALAHAL